HRRSHVDCPKADRSRRVDGRQGQARPTDHRRPGGHSSRRARVRATARRTSGDVMGIWQSVKDWLNDEPELQTRSDSIEDLIARMGINRANPWRKAGIKEALGVPAIFGAVNLISNITSSM